MFLGMEEGRRSSRESEIKCQCDGISLGHRLSYALNLQSGQKHGDERDDCLFCEAEGVTFLTYIRSRITRLCFIARLFQHSANCFQHNDRKWVD